MADRATQVTTMAEKVRTWRGRKSTEENPGRWKGRGAKRTANGGLWRKRRKPPQEAFGKEQGCGRPTSEVRPPAQGRRRAATRVKASEGEG